MNDSASATLAHSTVTPPSSRSGRCCDQSSDQRRFVCEASDREAPVSCEKAMVVSATMEQFHDQRAVNKFVECSSARYAGQLAHDPPAGADWPPPLRTLRPRVALDGQQKPC